MGRSDEDRNKRAGDVLGLGNAGASVTNHDSTWSDETDEAGRRRKRMSEGADELTPDTAGEAHQGGRGATGIDMGASGEGTDLE